MGISDVVGRYLPLEVEGHDYRIYYEEAGEGVPLLCQHTAGAHGAQWRHVLENDAITRNFRVIAYDLPYHGKSLPPASKVWWAEEYKLTKAFLMQVPVGLADALSLDRPVFMGSSIGGHLALDLASNHPDRFRAVVSLEGAAASPGAWLDIMNHPRVSNASKASVMYGLTAPTAPEAYRRETEFVYSQGAPPVFKGDLYYYSVDHGMDDAELAAIDTSRCAVHMLTGEYDWSATPAMSEETAKRIEGASYQTLRQLGHFPMCEDPDRFFEFVCPVLDRILEEGAA